MMAMKLVSIINVKYLPGLYALLQSIEDNGDLPDNTGFLLLYTEKAVLDHVAAIRRFRFKFEFMDIHELGRISAPLNRSGITHFSGVTLQKILIFNLPHDGPLCWIDVDMICLNSIRELMTMDHFTAATSNKKAFSPSQKYFNAGLMVFRPSASLFNQILEFIAEAEKTGRSFKHGDQGILNCFFHERHPEDVHIVGKWWNLSKKTEFMRPHQFILKKIKILHFLGTKPWVNGFWELFHIPFILPKRFHQADWIWWKYYFKSLPRVILRRD